MRVFEIALFGQPLLTVAFGKAADGAAFDLVTLSTLAELAADDTDDDGESENSKTRFGFYL